MSGEITVNYWNNTIYGHVNITIKDGNGNVSTWGYNISGDGTGRVFNESSTTNVDTAAGYAKATTTQQVSDAQIAAAVDYIR